MFLFYCIICFISVIGFIFFHYKISSHQLINPLIASLAYYFLLYIWLLLYRCIQVYVYVVDTHLRRKINKIKNMEKLLFKKKMCTCSTNPLLLSEGRLWKIKLIDPTVNGWLNDSSHDLARSFIIYLRRAEC